MLLYHPWSFLHVGHSICLYIFDFHRSALASAHQGQPLPKTLSVMESTPQVRGMHTIIRSGITHSFHKKRLLKICLKQNLSENNNERNSSFFKLSVIIIVSVAQRDGYLNNGNFSSQRLNLFHPLCSWPLCVCVGTRRLTEMSLSSTPRD